MDQGSPSTDRRSRRTQRLTDTVNTFGRQRRSTGRPRWLSVPRNAAVTTGTIAHFVGCFMLATTRVAPLCTERRPRSGQNQSDRRCRNDWTVDQDTVSGIGTLTRASGPFVRRWRKRRAIFILRFEFHEASQWVSRRHVRVPIHGNHFAMFQAGDGLRYLATAPVASWAIVLGRAFRTPFRYAALMDVATRLRISRVGTTVLASNT